MPTMLFAAIAASLQAAPSAADVADGKCVGALITLSEQARDAKDKAGIDGMMMFHIGKIVGRSGGAAVKPALTAAAAVSDAASLTQLAQSCASEAEKMMGGL
jgi:hypothetical protein